MAASSVAAFWAVAVLLILVPGADWAFTIGSGLRGHSTVAAVGGLVLGYAGITIVVAAGTGLLIARTPPILTGLTVAGGLYLMWHGARTLARPPAPASELAASRAPAPQAAASAGAARATLLKGIGVSALNPKGLLLFLALLPQFTSPRGDWPLPAQLGLLGLVFMATCAAFYLCLGTFTRKILHSRPAASRGVTRFSGAAMIVIGAVLLAERLASLH